MNLVVDVLQVFFNAVTIDVDCSAEHQKDISLEPFYNNRRTHLGLIHECCACYLTFYDVTAHPSGLLYRKLCMSFVLFVPS